MKRKISICNITTLLILILILAFGLLLRTRCWLLYPSFNCDEVPLIRNFLERNYWQLFLPLDYSQCCPPVFLIIGKFLYSLFGLNLIKLRIINYLASVFACLFFCILTFKAFKNKFAVIFANLLFVTHCQVCHFSTYFKHYPADILLSILIFLAVLCLKDKNLSKKQLVCLSIICVFCVLTSYTAGFVIFTTFLSFLILNSKNLKTFLHQSQYFLVPFATAIMIYFCINCAATIQNAGLQAFWHSTSTFEYFIPTTLSQIKDFLLFFAGGLYFRPLIVFILFLWGLDCFYKEEKFLFLLYFLPFVFACLLGILNCYPLSPSRVSLYLVPFFILIITKPMDYIDIPLSKSDFLNPKNLPQITYSLTVIGTFLLIANAKEAVNTWNYIVSEVELFRWTNAFEFYEILEKSDVSQDDYIFLDASGNGTFYLYDTKNIINKKNIIINWERYLLQEIPKGKNIYFFLHELYYNNYAEMTEWVNDNCKIQYEIEGYYGNFIKCKKITPAQKQKTK